MLLRAVTLAALLALLGCENTTLPADVREFSTPLLYRQWWAMTEACSERQRDIREIHWYASDGQQLRTSDGNDAGGFYTASRNSIVLRGDLRYDGAVVRHEMLHAILRNAKGHPRDAYLEKCAGTVICLEDCVREGGPWPAAEPGARLGPASLLTIRATSPHDTIFRSNPTFIYSAVVMATNETGSPLIVTLPPSGDDGPPATFGFEIVTPSVTLFYNERVANPGSVRFAVGETKRWVFDIKASEFSSGMAQFYGDYGDTRQSLPLNVVVLP